MQSSRRLVAVLSAACAWLSSVSALQNAQPGPRPQFETRTELVLVDVTVVDRVGEPVRDLTAADFELRVNGETRLIESLQFVSTMPAGDTAERPPREAASSSNDAPSSGRLLLFVVDEGNMRVGSSRTVLKTAQMLMDRLSPGDLVGLTRLPTGIGGVEFTADRQRVASALQRVTGSVNPRSAGTSLRISEAYAYETNDSISWQQAVDRNCAGESGLGLEACVTGLQSDARGVIMEASSRARATVLALEGLFKRLATLGTPVNVVMISEGLMVAGDRQNMDTLARHAAEARATLHIIRPGRSFFDIEEQSAPGTGAFFDDSLMSEGLEQLAGQTRGTLSQVNAGSGAGLFERLGRELSGYYLLGFEPTDADRTGRERRIRVEVRRRNSSVRSRPTFVIRETAAAAIASEIAINPIDRVKGLLSAALPTQGLPLRVASYTATSNEGSRVRVVIAAEVGEPDTDAAEWPLGLLVLDRNEKVVASSLSPVRLAPSSSREASPRLYLTSVLLDPGEYTLRLAALDAEGRAGSVHHTIRARLTEAPGRLEVSDLLLAAAPDARGDAPRPTASAVLDTETVQAMLEMNGSDQRTLGRARVRVQVAESPSAEALVTADAKHASRGDKQRAFAATLFLGVLPPGEYVARAIVSVPNQPDTTILRHFRLAPAASGTAAAAASKAPEPIDPDAAPVPLPPIRILAPVPRFLPELVVRPAVVGPFLDGLLELKPPSPAIEPIVEQARRGIYAAPDADGQVTADDELTLAFIRGLGALQKNEIAQATAWFQQTAKGATEFLGAAFYLGACFAAGGRDPEAIGAWQMALLSENPGAVYPLLVDAYLRIGDGRRAAEFLEEAPAAWSDDNERVRREATAEALVGEYSTALPKLAGLLQQKQSDDPSLLFVAIQVLYRLHEESGGLRPEQRTQFAEYVARYERAKGPNVALVHTWRKYVMP